MMLRRFKIICFCFVIMACNNKQRATEITTKTSKANHLTEADVAKIKYLEFAIDPKVEVLVEPWQPYSRLKTTIENIKIADFFVF